MFCTNCGGQIPEGSGFCPGCGAKAGGSAPGATTPYTPTASRMLLVNIDYIPGKQLTVLGLVKGNSAQARNAGKDLMAGFKNIVGGEISGYSEMTASARDIALQRMQEQAAAMGADAILNIRYDSASLAVQGIAEVMVYGTAVKINEEF